MQIKGVNFGGWLVLEKWIAPELFAGTEADDEYHLARVLSEEEYRERMERHRGSFIREEDFRFLSEQGINTIRIPIPFYIFGDRAPYLGCIEYLDFALDMAEKYGLKILIDLHMVPGSQNGFDNGGICGVCKWSGMPEEVDFCLQLLEKLALRYGHRDGLWGIQPLNEPITDALTGDIPWEQVWIRNIYPPKSAEEEAGSAPIKMEFLRKFYEDAYTRVMPHMDEDKFFMIHDAFRTAMWKDFMPREQYRNVVLDTHFYFGSVEAGGCPKALEAYQAIVERRFYPILDDMSGYFPVVTGEWSLDSGYAKDLPDRQNKENAYRTVAEIQQKAWERIAGSFFWTYRILSDSPDADAWSFEKAIKWMK